MTDWILEPVCTPDATVREAAQARQAQLTKPPGSLGRLEDLAVAFAARQGRERPSLDAVWISVFAADHGVARAGVSAFPQAVTLEMVRNFVRGGAAISVLARELGAELEVINLGTVDDPGPMEGVRAARLGPGSSDFTAGPAMSEAQFEAALAEGRGAVERARAAGAGLFIGGEMGIGNTSAAAALAAALLGLPAVELTGPGTGLDAAGVLHKAAILQRALDFHGTALAEPREALRRLGGFEIAALAGAFLRAAQLGLPVLVDGFIASAAALAAARLNPAAAAWPLYAHASAEPGHRRILAGLEAEPLLDLGLRLGEGSGAAVAVCLLRQALALHNGMATFAEAGVSGKEA
ncbi:nicotinate-nucleotide--dimethylbenzimidazole phosphoribosyltransferase [Thiohalobacter sp. IOR34]|uniref:nicotinate-nucleotide--dimethylbenzimidazole phosphoribosyltransferase n=1 Tax=Thiohalobacter sp. IOR34 TaxID=3057176 RepID=UPI0025AF5971|nr:nicotinate-nucleotide--dimethylbenzimidazole phosphoribosyltransferase [Thiohalobacter sp. IOR34]WJW75161.1 nicotinate-nucleotide--dimethylbenzimidazole phosphoribosyltransferase [Thiohalobacter sp. IOR34]